MLVLVNNAGVRADGLSPRLADEDWERVLETNLSAAFRTTRRSAWADDPGPLRPRHQRRVGGGPASQSRAGELRRLEGGARGLHEDCGG